MSLYKGSSSLMWGLGLGGVGIGAFLYLSRRPRPMQAQAQLQAPLSQEDEEEDVPEDIKDTITLSVITDPCILTATGQLYSYQSIRDWFSNGGTLCPKTNMEVVDVQLVRVPWVKERIRLWQEQNSTNVSTDEEAPIAKRVTHEAFSSIHPSLADWIKSLRSDTGHQRSLAITELFKLLRQRETMATSDPAFEAYEAKHRMIRDEVLDDCIWLLRHGESYIAGVACSILTYCDTSDEISWLSRCASFPAALLLNSSNHYSSQAATRLLYNILRNQNEAGKRAVKAAGGVCGLMAVIRSTRDDYGGFSRSRAAAALAELVRDDDSIRSLVIKNAASLVGMLHSDDRFEARDAATCLSRLKMTEEELARQGTSSSNLTRYRYCSQAWLNGLVSNPEEGLLESERESNRQWIEFEGLILEGRQEGGQEAQVLARA